MRMDQQMEYTDNQEHKFLAELSGHASQELICQAIREYFGCDNPIVFENADCAFFDIDPWFLDVKDGFFYISNRYSETDVLRKSEDIFTLTCQEQVDGILAKLVSTD